MLENAESVLNGTMESDFLKEMVNNHYHTAFGPFDWLFEDKDIYTPRAVTCALYAAYAATKTAVGYFALDNLERFHRAGFVTINPDGKPSLTPNAMSASGMGDVELGGEAGSDGAASAMVAFATYGQAADIEPDKVRGFRFIIDSARKLAFWEWWLTEAIPQAWEKASG